MEKWRVGVESVSSEHSVTRLYLQKVLLLSVKRLQLAFAVLVKPLQFAALVLFLQKSQERKG